MRDGTPRRGARAFACALASAACAIAFASSGPLPQGPPTIPSEQLRPLPPITDDGPLRFEDLSEASEGPLDFACPRSTVEKSSCAFFDADGDGWDDMVTLTGVGEPHRYFMNRPDGSGGRRLLPAPPGNGLDNGASFARDGASLTVGDVDADGDEDLYIGCGWNSLLPAGAGRNLLLLNDGTGRFTNVAETLGLGDGDNTTAACAFFDMDLDGDLDLLSCNTDAPDAGKEGDGLAHLFRNTLSETGALAFVEETAIRGVTEDGTAVWNVLANDYDNDGDADLVIGHDFVGYTQLFRNDGTGHFTDVTQSVGAGEGDDANPSTFGDDSRNAMGNAVGDIENDGDFDLYVSDGRPGPLYVNRGDGTFTLLTAARGAETRTVGWGATFEDFDLDGFVDLHVAGGDFWNFSRDLVRGYLFQNKGDGTFTEVWGGSGMLHEPPLHREQGTATADFDRDGRIDLLVTRAERRGASPYFYRNISDVGARRWLQVKLVGNGTTSNVSAIGAKLRVFPRKADGTHIAGLTQLREVHGQSSRGSRSSLLQHMGLGAAAVAADVEVEWPRAGTMASRRQLFVDVPLDQVVVIPETPDANVWHLAATATIDVPDARATDVTCPGNGPSNPLTTLTVETAPSWITGGPWRDGRTVHVAAPRLKVAQVETVSLVANTQGAGAGGESRQTMTIRVVPAPLLLRLKGKVKKTLTVVGDHFDMKTLAVTLDGTPCTVGKVRTQKRGKKILGQTAVIKFPKEMRASMKTGQHVVHVVDSATGLAATLQF